MNNIQITKIPKHTQQCIAFLSTLPIAKWTEQWGKEKIEDINFSQCAYAFPIAGIAIATIPAIIMIILDAFGIEGYMNATITWITMIIITGAIHEDGLADMVDGFCGGKDKKTKIKIMKDSRIGVYGTIALVFSIAMRIMALGYLIIQHGAIVAGLVFIMIAAISRAAMIVPWAKDTNAPDTDTGDSSANSIGKPAESDIYKTTILCMPIAIVMILCIGIFASVIVGAAAAGAVMAVMKLCEYHIKEIRGDCIGATQQCCEIAMYIAVSAYA